MAPPAIILVRPQLGWNIGAAARAMANFGLDDLRIVAPRDGWPNEDARAMATGAEDILERASLHATTREAVGDLHRLWATTARHRDMAKPVLAPGEVARACRSGELRSGILFGPESTGLANDEVVLADALVRIPTSGPQRSLNLAQAVLVLAWECSGSTEAATPWRTAATPATMAEFDGFFDQLVGALDSSGFLRNREQRPVTVRNLRTMFQRAGLSGREVRTLRGVVSALAGRSGGDTV